MEKIYIGSRGSRLALVQSESVKEELQKAFPDITFELVIIKTKGDKILDTPLAKIGDKGLFTKELEQGLLDGKIDLAVHSMKDMPTLLPEGLKIAAITERLNPCDILISKNGLKIQDLKPGHSIATGSLRRKAQLLAHEPQLNITDIRGNVNTRIQKMTDNPSLDGLILAYAGLHRLDMDDTITEIIDENIILPAVGQAALAIETRDGDKTIDDIVSFLDHEESRISISCERSFLASLEGGCQVPIAGYCRVIDATLSLTGLVAAIDGSRVIKKTMTAPLRDWDSLGRELAESLIEEGADLILNEIYRNS